MDLLSFREMMVYGTTSTNKETIYAISGLVMHVSLLRGSLSFREEKEIK